jgi:MFS transporter, ACS family, pantothenate transporter
VTGSMNEMAYVFQAWLPLLIWKQVEGPQYRKGFITATFIAVALISTAFLIRHLHRRELRAKKANSEEVNIVEERTEP